MDRNEFLDIITPAQRAELNALIRRLGGGSWEVDEDAVDVTDAGSAVEERLTTLLVRLNGRNGTLAHRWSGTALAQAVDPTVLVAGGIRTLTEHVARWEAEGLVELTAEQAQRDADDAAFDRHVIDRLVLLIEDNMSGETLYRQGCEDPDADDHDIEVDTADLHGRPVITFKVAGRPYTAVIYAAEPAFVHAEPAR